ncbi:MAG TPA: hypothetical protein VNU68_08265 [Verrucomicrobiae bacterium]|nr:hypothetical protein [Verrucomicrobiae bacterium]
MSAEFAQFELPSKATNALLGGLCWIALIIFLGLTNILQAQDHTVLFSTSDPGVSKAVTNWGVGTVGGPDVMRNGLIYMGADEIDVINYTLPAIRRHHQWPDRTVVHRFRLVFIESGVDSDQPCCCKRLLPTGVSVT